MDQPRKKSFYFSLALYSLACRCSELHFSHIQRKDHVICKLARPSWLGIRPTSSLHCWLVGSPIGPYWLIYQSRNKNKWPNGQPSTTAFLLFQLETKSSRDPAFLPSLFPTPSSCYYQKRTLHFYGYPDHLPSKALGTGPAVPVWRWLRVGLMKMSECWQKVILNSSALRYNTFIM